ncbi:hypothetical protein D3C86_1742770 [compost metagenome]
MKLPKAGSPQAAIANNNATDPICGAELQSPLISLIFRVCKRSLSIPARMNNAAALIP